MLSLFVRFNNLVQRLFQCVRASGHRPLCGPLVASHIFAARLPLFIGAAVAGSDRAALVVSPIKKGLPSSPVVLLIVQRVAAPLVSRRQKKGRWQK